jgi:hypothetical protein
MTHSLKLAFVAAGTAIIISGVAAYAVRAIFGTDHFETYKSSYDVKDPGIYIIDRLSGAARYCTKAGCWPLTNIEKPDLAPIDSGR